MIVITLGRIPKHFIKHVDEAQDFRCAFIGYKSHFISFNFILIAFKISWWRF